MQCDWDFFVTGSFLYWQPQQDNMDVGIADDFLVTQLLPTALVPAAAGFKGNFIDLNFKYKPGFKVAAGLNLQNDDWVAYAEYTRWHGQHEVFSNGTSGNPTVYATWGHPFILENFGQVFDGVRSTFHCNLDFVDAEMERVYYVGKSLIFHSTWGARGAWISENMHVHYFNTSSPFVTAGTVTSLPSKVDVYGRVHSWAVGPRAGIEMDWMLGEGVRFFGSGFADVLWTKYKVQDKTVVIPLVTDGVVLTGNSLSMITRDRVGALRAHVDLETGFGWGMYIDNANSWHIDLMAAYGFQVFFNQNMFQHFNSSSVIGNHYEEHGNLYVQGLTVTARLDF